MYIYLCLYTYQLIDIAIQINIHGVSKLKTQNQKKTTKQIWWTLATSQISTATGSPLTCTMHWIGASSGPACQIVRFDDHLEVIADATHLTLVWYKHGWAKHHPLVWYKNMVGSNITHWFDTKNMVGSNIQPPQPKQIDEIYTRCNASVQIGRSLIWEFLCKKHSSIAGCPGWRHACCNIGSSKGKNRSPNIVGWHSFRGYANRTRAPRIDETDPYCWSSCTLGWGLCAQLIDQDRSRVLDIVDHHDYK